MTNPLQDKRLNGSPEPTGENVRVGKIRINSTDQIDRKDRNVQDPTSQLLKRMEDARELNDCRPASAPVC
jgi:hypothetical protein